jgi:peptide/nickel transport system substrate-binding protein
MKNVLRFMVIGLLVLAISMLIAPISAQEGGEGGVLITDNIGDDVPTFNPLIASDTTSSLVYGWMYPSLYTIDLDTGQNAPNQPQAMATGWEYDETGTVMTIHMREDAYWNDGTQITSADWMWGAEAIWSGETSSPRTSQFAELLDGTPAGGPIVDIEAPDDFTVVLTFEKPSCIALNEVFTPMVPAHIWEDLYGADYALMDEGARDIPTVTFGPFKDLEFEPGARVSLLADQDYPDTQLGYVAPSEWVFLSIGSTDLAVERFRAGDITHTTISPDYQEEFRGSADFQIYEYNDNGFSYLAFNNANPENPMAGMDEDGNLVEQDPHPVFGNVNVRVALTHATDIDAIIDGLYGGNGTRIGTHTIPQSWTFNSELSRSYDPELAAQMLDDAGWVIEEGSEWRVCRGCAYTEVDPEFEGSEMVFNITANEGNDIRERMAQFTVSAWNELGVGAQYETLDWGSAFLPTLVGQTFDVVTLGWSLGLPDDGDMSWAYGPEADLPEAGFNFVSFFDAEFNELQDAQKDPMQTDGCDEEIRKGMIARSQEILYEQQPYIYLLNTNVMYALQSNIEGFSPKAYSRIWNIDAWTVND